MNYNYYNKKLKAFARLHRNDSTKAEIRLWCELLSAKKMHGYSFLRQRPIGNYIADFFSKDLKLIIEVDGITHDSAEQVEKDLLRESDLKNLGFNIIRFQDDEVMHDIENVSRVIENYIHYWEENHPPPPFKGGRQL